MLMRESYLPGLLKRVGYFFIQLRGFYNSVLHKDSYAEKYCACVMHHECVANI